MEISKSRILDADKVLRPTNPTRDAIERLRDRIEIQDREIAKLKRETEMLARELVRQNHMLSRAFEKIGEPERGNASLSFRF